MDVNIGIDDAAREEISGQLGMLPAGTYTLCLKTQDYHWNITGPMFRNLHLMFEEQYVELRDAVDEIAERIRALGYPAPGSFAEFSGLTTIPESEAAPEAVARSTRRPPGCCGPRLPEPAAASCGPRRSKGL